MNKVHSGHVYESDHIYFDGAATATNGTRARNLAARGLKSSMYTHGVARGGEGEGRKTSSPSAVCPIRATATDRPRLRQHPHARRRLEAAHPTLHNPPVAHNPFDDASCARLQAT